MNDIEIKKIISFQDGDLIHISIQDPSEMESIVNVLNQLNKKPILFFSFPNGQKFEIEKIPEEIMNEHGWFKK